MPKLNYRKGTQKLKVLNITDLATIKNTYLI